MSDDARIKEHKFVDAVVCLTCDAVFYEGRWRQLAALRSSSPNSTGHKVNEAKAVVAETEKASHGA